MNTLYELGVRKLAANVRDEGYTKESVAKALLPVFMLLPCLIQGKGKIQQLNEQFNVFCDCTLEPCVNGGKKPEKVDNISVNFHARNVLLIILWLPVQCIVINITFRKDRFIVGHINDVMINKDPSLLYLKKFFKNIWR